MAERILVTSEGLKELHKELEHLRTVKRGEISDKIRIARSFGDLSENNEYDEAKNEQAIVEARISFLEEQLKNAEILDTSTLPTDVVNIGSIVTIYDKEFDEEMTYKIVTSLETNHPGVETITDQSPVGKALLGHKVGNEIEALLPNGSKAAYKILATKF